MGSTHRQYSSLLAFLIVGFGIAGGRPARANEQAVDIAAESSSPRYTNALSATVVFPGHNTFLLSSPSSSWARVGSLSFSVDWPAAVEPSDGDDAAAAQVMMIVEDRDHFWYQNLLPNALAPGAPNHYRVSLRPGEQDWQAVGHQSTWNLRALVDPLKVGLRIFGRHSATNRIRLYNVRASPRQDQGAPRIGLVRTLSDRVHAYEKFEVRFRLPDRYLNPFDADEVLVTADFEGPDGQTTRVDGFHARSYYREVLPTGDRVVPQGAPYWCVRFTPRAAGAYRYRLNVRDRFGSDQWGGAGFEALPPRRPGFIRVSARDPRFFEFSDGSFFYPLGHNVRSPFDARMDRQFPLRQRWEAGASVYEYYLPTMARHGENFTELWFAAWSLGLEWSEGHPGYHGVGDYNLEHAWELDRVLELAEQEGIYVNLVVHNHGKFSLHWDSEWEANPYNKACGGFLDSPEQFFSDARAIAAFRRFMRYVIARWGYSPHVFAWQLWSELDLVGSQKGFAPTPDKFYKQPVVVDWHRLMGRAIKDMDPFDHLVATHVCKDYSHQNVEIVSLPEMDFGPLDAYYYTDNPLAIADLLRRTAVFNRQFNKPVLVTEFGGSPEAQSIDHLQEALHAGLWSSVAIPLGGAPMFWWWQLVDEENYYPMFAAHARFMNGIDRRDPALVMTSPALQKVPPKALEVYCLQNRSQAFGWICDTRQFGRPSNRSSGDREPLAGAILRFNALEDGEYRAEFWDTQRGEVMTNRVGVASNEVLRVEIPPFIRDIAFKIHSPHERENLREAQE